LCRVIQRLHRGLIGPVVLLLLFGAARANADNKDPTPEEVAAARDLAKEGVRLARAGNCEAAIPKLERARELYESPVIPAVALGDCLIRAGRLVRGTEILQMVVRANLGPKAESVNLAAKEQAKRLLEPALPKIAKLVVQLEGPAGVDAAVTIDKQPLPKSLVGIGRPSDPGEHVVEASGRGVQTVSRVVTLAEGQESTVTLTLVAVVAPPPPSPPGAAIAPQERPSRLPAIILLGVGGAGIVTGGVTGVLALTTRSKLSGECPNDKCPGTAAGDLSSLKTLSWISTLGFAAGAVSAGVGVFLLVRAPSDAPKTGVRVVPVVGPGSVGLRGEF